VTERRRSRFTALLLLALVACGGAACTDAHEGKAIDRGPGIVPPKVTPSLIRLERTGATSCPSWCPTYSVEIDVEGGVTYTGVLHVKTIGPAAGHVDQDGMQRIRTLMAKARQARFPKERCACGCVKDASMVTLTTWEKGAARTVAYDEGCENAPHAVRVLEGSVDELVGVERWTGTIQQRRLCFEEERDCAEFGTPQAVGPDGGR
jgi:hypothetical protein